MNWLNNIPNWQNTGQEPPAQKLVDGFQRERLPYAWLNWILNALSVNLKENRDNIDKLEQDTDAKIAAVSATGIAKLNVYDFKTTSTAAQRIFTFNLSGFDVLTDTVRIYTNSVRADSAGYSVTNTAGGFTVEFVTGFDADTVLLVEVWKHVPMGIEGMVTGLVIAPDTLPVDRVIGLQTELDQIKADIAALQGP